MSRYSLGFLGAGKLAGSVIRGLLRAKFCEPGQILASEPADPLREDLRNDLGIAVTTDNLEVAREAQILFLGVKPGVVLPVLRDIAEAAGDKLIVSLAAGVRIPAMEAVARGPVIRALTNTPSAICRAATAISRGSRTTGAHVAAVTHIFEAVGVVVEVPEEQIDVVTALSGSGPAFVYTVIEALAQGGENLGLAHDVALKLATQTALGAAQIALESGMSPEALRKMVVTPGGTTAAGLTVMAEKGVSEGLIDAVEAATKRGQEMARENS